MNHAYMSPLAKVVWSWRPYQIITTHICFALGLGPIALMGLKTHRNLAQRVGKPRVIMDSTQLYKDTTVLVD